MKTLTLFSDRAVPFIQIGWNNSSQFDRFPNQSSLRYRICYQTCQLIGFVELKGRAIQFQRLTLMYISTVYKVRSHLKPDWRVSRWSLFSVTQMRNRILSLFTSLDRTISRGPSKLAASPLQLSRFGTTAATRCYDLSARLFSKSSDRHKSLHIPRQHRLRVGTRNSILVTKCGVGLIMTIKLTDC